MGFWSWLQRNCFRCEPLGGGCKRGWRVLVCATESKIHEGDGTGRSGGGGIVEGAVSRGAGDGDFLQRMAAGSGAADVDEQSGPGSGREATGADCLRRDRARGEELGMLPRHRAVAARAGGGRNAAGAIRE